MDRATERPDSLQAGVDFASELIIPGGSNLVEGDFKQGAIHAVLGLVAKSMFGLPGLIAVSANSFSKATTGRHLYEHLGLGARPGEEARADDEAVAPVQATTAEGPPKAPPPARRAARKASPASRRKKVT